MTIQEYLSGLKDKRVAVLGIGVSNTPLIKMLRRHGIAVTARDKASREDLGERAEELLSLGAELCLGPDYLEHLDEDVIFRTPGMRPDLPQLLQAKEQGSVITSEMEVFFQVCPCPIIAVTGSDGKTTTTTIIANMLQEAGYHTYLGGNIGKPLLPDVDGMEPEDYAVVELSSFQLMTMEQSAHVAVVTNLAPNHLDVHKGMEEYIAAKRNVFAHQHCGDRAVFNLDNEITRGFMADAPGQAVGFSRLTVPDQGVYLQGDAIWVSDEKGKRPVLSRSDIQVPGEHNVENFMAAIAAVNGIVPDEAIAAAAGKFTGVEHRIELVRVINGARYYNDSIATSPTRTMAGLHAFGGQKVILIAGGYDKHIPFAPMVPDILKSVKHLVLTGATAEKIAQSVRSHPDYAGAPPISLYEDFTDAVRAAHSMAQPGDIVTLSPACAAFDKFKNFAQRGEVYKKIIREL